ncbi:universal stress protein [Saccharothrix coeruleofusca]|uniref:Universal stress protein n=1 Tax=Saccharothrix coeruleofusca TaxID=33919 RepID=A0A918EGU0_9PSEU|nr:universal stress protein [Saccharothrix coeruleofusca]MBP2335687.1 nucleotide-binding universal stress UspA family protein [Saccharothrix coeruleofusca]GGP75772.1 universal stress protein [Saccharothrix coeruleofusca]
MDRKIVVGVDGSTAGRTALGWAVEEARLRGCAVEAVLTWHADYGMVIDALATGVDRAALEQESRGVLREAVAGFADEVRSVLVEGDARDVLVRASRDAELLVVGNRGAGPVRGALLGSVSSYCVHHAHCPVVVIRQPKAPVEPAPAAEAKPVITPGPLL